MATTGLFQDALELPEADRASLAHLLLRSLETASEDPDWQSAWATEIEERLARVNEGNFQAKEWREAVAEARSSLKEKTS